MSKLDDLYIALTDLDEKKIISEINNMNALEVYRIKQKLDQLLKAIQKQSEVDNATN